MQEKELCGLCNGDGMIWRSLSDDFTCMAIVCGLCKGKGRRGGPTPLENEMVQFGEALGVLVSIALGAGLGLIASKALAYLLIAAR